MLQFILGTAGTGKTTLLFEKIIETIRGGQKAILLVPEQFSFESEKRLYRALGPVDSLQVEVLSFTRLCDNIFREYGGLAGTPVTAAGKYLLMSVAVKEMQDQLLVYQKSAQNLSFLDSLLSACSEFKSAGVTPEQLLEYSSLTSNQKLQNKLTDLSSLYGTYQALLATGYTDSDDDLMKACLLLENNNYFNQFNVFVDGFTTFMAGEYELLSHILSQSPQLTLAMTCSKDSLEHPTTGVFSPVAQAVNYIKKQAEKYGTIHKEPIFLENTKRFQQPDLAYLSKHYMKPDVKPYSKDCAITLFAAQNSYLEVLYCATQIADLVQHHNLRYRDICVVARDHTNYLRYFSMLFSQYDIPFFDDRTTDVENTPLIMGLMGALEAVRSNYDSESMLLLAKSPMMGLEEKEVAQLENYVYMWGIKGPLWLGEFRNNPRGMSEHFTQQDLQLLQQINDVRTSLITPLERFKKSVKKNNGLEFAQGVYEFLCDVHASAHLKEFIKKFPATQGELLLDQTVQLWDQLMDVLDVFGQVLKDHTIPYGRLCELMRLAVSCTELGHIPQTLDQVLIGSADRIRPWDMKAVFILGANDGVFPPSIGSSGVFSQQERQLLTDTGLSLFNSGYEQTLLEYFYSYFALTLPSDYLSVSYSNTTLNGKDLLPSLMVTQLNDLFPQLKQGEITPEKTITNHKTAFHFLAQNYHTKTSLTHTLQHYLEQHYLTELSRMNQASFPVSHQLLNSELPQKLFGESMRFSPSRVEQFYRCPFSYFAQNALNLKKRKKMEFSPLQSGDFIHHVLQVMVQQHGGKGLAELSLKQMRQQVSSIIADYLQDRILDHSAVSKRFENLFERLTDSLARLLHHLGLEFQQSLYQPWQVELPIRQGEEITPLRLTTPDGIPVCVEGIVDRVDIMEKNGKKYVRVIDYKSGKKDFKLQDVLYGLNLQMLLYLFTICEQHSGELDGAIPGGILYMPVKENYLSTERDSNEETIQQVQQRQWTMNGLLLDDQDSLLGMEAELKGIFIPAKLSKDGNLDGKSSIASLSQMGKLSQKVKEQIVLMASQLSEGMIQSLPVSSGDYPACQWCDYRTVCGYEEGNPVREIAKIDRETVLNILEQEDDNGGTKLDHSTI